MAKTLKNYQLLDLLEAFTRISQIEMSSNKKFNYAVVVNDEVIKPYTKAILGVAKPTEEYLEYENKRNELVNLYSEKDSEGRPVIVDNRWTTIVEEYKETFTNAINLLNEEYSDIIELRNKDIEDYNNLLEEDVKVDIITISLNDLPDVIGNDIVLVKLLRSMIK